MSLVRLATEVALRLPHPWYFASIERDAPGPEGWPKGNGTRIILRQEPPTYKEWENKQYEMVAVTLMPGAYDAEKPMPHSGRAPAAFLQEWSGTRVFLWKNGHETWPTFEDDIRNALSSAVGKPTAAPETGTVAVGPIQFEEVHMNTRDREHGYHRCGAVADSASGMKLWFDLHFTHPLYFHLDRTSGKDVLAVRTNRMVAIVPMDRF